MAELYTIIIKNSSGSNQEIEELGITILDSSSYNISNEFDYQEIFSSTSLRTLVDNGTLIVNNGTTDLSASDGLDWIDVINIYNLKSDFFSKTQLQTPGQSIVDWSNIANVPSFGSLIWKKSVIYRVLNITGTTTGAIAGDTIVDGTSYKRFDGSIWTTINTVATDDRIIDLSQTGQHVIYYDGTSWGVTGTLEESAAIMVDDDGDTKQAQYIYDGSEWLKIGDVDFTGHFDGGPSKHDASEIDVEGTYVSIPGTPTDLETTIEKIDASLTANSLNATDKNDLNEAYNQDGSGVGRIINADAGSVKIIASNGYSPFELSNLATAPNTGLATGQMCVVDGILYIYDQTRLKWLSSFRESFIFGRPGVTQNSWLSYCAGNLPSNNSGFRVLRNSVITAISAQVDKPVVNGSADINIRRNDATPNIATLSLASGTSGNSDDTYNVNLLKDEFIQCHLDKVSTGGVEDIIVKIEFAYTV